MKLLIEAPKRDGLTDICMICKKRGDCWDLNDYTEECRLFSIDEDRAESLCVETTKKEPSK